MLSWKKILCPVDFSATSRAAMRLAAELSARLEAPLELFNVVLPPTLAVAEAPLPSPELIEAMLEASRQQLMLWKREADALGAKQVEIAQELGLSTEAILNRAKQTGCDVIVMGTHGRGLVKRVLLGSVAEHTLRSAPCPVLTVGPQAGAAAERMVA